MIKPQTKMNYKPLELPVDLDSRKMKMKIARTMTWLIWGEKAGDWIDPAYISKTPLMKQSNDYKKVKRVVDRLLK